MGRDILKKTLKKSFSCFPLLNNKLQVSWFFKNAISFYDYNIFLEKWEKICFVRLMNENFAYEEKINSFEKWILGNIQTWGVCHSRRLNATAFSVPSSCNLLHLGVRREVKEIEQIKYHCLIVSEVSVLISGQ